MMRLGPGALNNSELLALVFGNGLKGKSALDLGEEASKNGLVPLARQTAAEIAKLKGLGEAKACRLAAAFELGRRSEREKAVKRVFIRTSREAAAIVQASLRNLPKEHLKVLLLNSRNALVGEETVCMGSVNANAVAARDVFKTAIEAGAAAVVLAHNHPSGDPSPSDEDVETTRKLADAGRLLGIQVLDHVIIGDGRFFSLRERNLF